MASGWALGHLVGAPTTDLGNGVLDALISAGRIELLSNRELRARVAEWKGVFGEVHDDEVMNRKLVFELVIPYLTRWGRSLDSGYAIVSNRYYLVIIKAYYGHIGKT